MRVAEPWLTPAAVSASDNSGSIASGATTPSDAPLIASRISTTAAGTVDASSSAEGARTIDGPTSPTRTDTGARSPGVATSAITGSQAP